MKPKLPKTKTFIMTHSVRHKRDGMKVPGTFIKYLLGTVLAAYKDFEDRFALVETKLPVLETVRHATMNKTAMESFFKYFLKHLQTPSVCC